MRWFVFLHADSTVVCVRWEGTSVHPRWPFPALATGTYVPMGIFSELPNLAVAERPCLWGQGLYRSTPLLKNLRVCAVFPSSLVSSGSPRDRTLNSGRLAQPCFWHFVHRTLTGPAGIQCLRLKLYPSDVPVCPRGGS